MVEKLKSVEVPHFEVLQQECPVCRNTGWHPASVSLFCSLCDGLGTVPVVKMCGRCVVAILQREQYVRYIKELGESDFYWECIAQLLSGVFYKDASPLAAFRWKADMCKEESRHRNNPKIYSLAQESVAVDVIGG